MQNGYMSGFGNEFATEALHGALPVGQNSPQRCPYGLYAEQLSGSAFTAPRGENRRSWLYRIRPSVRHSGRFRRIEMPLWLSAPSSADIDLPLGQLRWSPPPLPNEALGFADGMRTMTVAGSVLSQSGLAAHYLFVTETRSDEAFFNADGEMLVVPQNGPIAFDTECGSVELEPGEVCILPRGMVFKTRLLNGPVRAYVCENYGPSFSLPGRGPIGANGLANERDFKSPTARFEDTDTPHRLVVKWGGTFHESEIPASPLDVVAWHGNYAPVKYDLRLYSPVGAILNDHPDPSIFTVLTAPSGQPGTANCDFVIFPDRWMVAENTFRPPWYHRNLMSEFMGMIYGVYDAKPDGFKPGGASLHNMMLSHGPDAEAFEGASHADLQPHKQSDTMAFMFESRLPQMVTPYAAQLATRDDAYPDCWAGLKKRFNGTPEGDWS